MPSNIYIPMPQKVALINLTLTGNGYSDTMTLYTTIQPIQDIRLQIYGNRVDTFKDVCRKCKYFTERVGLLEEYKAANPGSAPTSEQLIAWSVSRKKCMGGESIISGGQCLYKFTLEQVRDVCSTARVSLPKGLTFIKQVGTRISGTSISLGLNKNHPWRLMVLKGTEEGVQYSPYRIGNVYDQGNICWGNQNRDQIPDSPKAAFRFFFGSPFNGDLLGHGLENTLKQTMETYKVLGPWRTDPDVSVCFKHPFFYVRKEVDGNRTVQGVRIPGKCEGVVIATSPNIVDLAPEWARMEMSGRQVVIARANPTPTGIAFSFGDGKLHITKGTSLTAKTTITTIEGRVLSLLAFRAKSDQSDPEIEIEGTPAEEEESY